MGHLGELKAQNRANTAWAFAKVGHLDEPLLQLWQSRPSSAWVSSTRRSSPTPWAFATAGQLDELLFAALAKQAKQRLGEFNAQELANTAWAFATAGQLDELLFAALAKQAKQR